MVALIVARGLRLRPGEDRGAYFAVVAVGFSLVFLVVALRGVRLHRISASCWVRVTDLGIVVCSASNRVQDLGWGQIDRLIARYANHMSAQVLDSLMGWSRLDIRGDGVCLKIPAGIDDPEALAGLLQRLGRLRRRPPSRRSDIAVWQPAEYDPLGPGDHIARE